MTKNTRLEELKPQIIELINRATCSITMNPYVDVLEDIRCYLGDKPGGILTDPNVLIEAAENALKHGDIYYPRKPKEN